MLRSAVIKFTHMEDIYQEMNDLESKVPNLGLTGVVDALAEMKDEVEKYQNHSHLILF